MRDNQRTRARKVLKADEKRRNCSYATRRRGGLHDDSAESRLIDMIDSQRSSGNCPKTSFPFKQSAVQIATSNEDESFDPLPLLLVVATR